MGSKAGADMNNGLTINGEDHSLLYEKILSWKLVVSTL